MTAKFTESPRIYTVTFKDYNGNSLMLRNYSYGDTPIFDLSGGNPQRPSDAQYDYTFVGWNPEIHSVDGANVYTAVYSGTLRSYHVNWSDDNGPLTSSQELPYGTVPTYDGPIPTKPASAGKTYTFRGWTDGTREYGKEEAFPEVTGEVTYTAVFDETVESYLIQFKGFNEEILQTGNYEFGATPTYTGATPTKPFAIFSGWDSEITSVTGPKDYIAVFSSCDACAEGTGATCSLSVVNNACTYTNACKNGYENLSTTTGNNPSCSLTSYSLSYTGIEGLTVDNPASYTIETEEIILNEPSKVGFNFLGWFTDGEKITTIPHGSTGNKTFTARWEEIPYTVTFIFHNGEEDLVMTGHYGKPLSFPADPIKAGSTF